MNIAYPQTELVVAKTCGCKESGKQRVTYAFSVEFHSICVDKKDILQAEIQACEKLLKYLGSESERAVVQREITELKMALDLLT